MKIESPLQRQILSWAAAVLALCVLTACSPGSPAPADATSPAVAVEGSSLAKAGDPAATDEDFRKNAIAIGLITARKACDLLVRADAEAAVGQPLPQNTVILTLGMCDYNTADFSAGASITVSSWESIKAAATSKHQPQAMAGIGDEALYFAGSLHGGSPLYVRRGDEGFLLVLNGPKIDHMSGADAIAVEKELALKVLGKF